MKIKKFLFLGLFLLLLLPFASCAEKDSLEDRGYTVAITYDFNGGIVDETAKRVLYYKPNQPLLQPGASNELKAPVLDSRHTVEGWYRALTDENGQIQKDENGQILTEDTPFNFENARATESMTLVVRWKDNPTVTIMVDGRDPDERTFAAGDTVERFTYMQDREGYTFYDYYKDEACTEKVDWPLLLQDGEHITVYTKWLEGDVLIVRSRSDLSKLPQYRTRTVFFDADIDYAGSRTSFPTMTDFSGQIIGNGHVIRNVTKDVTLGKSSNGFGLFGELKNGAEIRDLNFENVTINIKIAWNAAFPIGLLGSTATADTVIDNCTLTDCNVLYTKLASAAEATILSGAGEPYEAVIGKADASLSYHVTGSVMLRENNS